jgi:adenylate cyclase
MAKEIEYKYLAHIGHGFRSDRARIIDSAYLTSGDPEVRIARYRGDEGTYQITVKKGSGLVREEIIVNIDDEKGLALFNMSDARISKRRHNVGRWEVDVFLGRYQGLVLAEIEMASEDEQLPIPPAGLVLLKDVTHLQSYKNKNLALGGEMAVACILDGYESALTDHLRRS